MKYYKNAALFGTLFFWGMLIIGLVADLTYVFGFAIFSGLPMMMVISRIASFLEPFLEIVLPFINGKSFGAFLFLLSPWLTWVLIFLLGAFVYKHRNAKLQFPFIFSKTSITASCSEKASD